MAISTSSIQRVKVYCFDDGKWDDRGTGHVSMDYMERSQELGLYVIDEDDHTTLLVHRISIEDIYRKQEDTIISWRDAEGSTEFALSFQETTGCCYVWDQISYLRRNLNLNFLDVVLSGVLDDDATSANLKPILTANKATVLTLLKDDRIFFKELFARLRSPSTSMESKDNLVHFLHEFCRLSRSILQMEQQQLLFCKLVNDGIFEIIAEVLESPDQKLVLTCADILYMFLTSHPGLVRSYVVQPETPLLGLLVKGMMVDFGDAMECQFIEIFRILFDSDASSFRGAQGVNIVDIFCDKHLPELVDFITASCSETPNKTSESASKNIGIHCGTSPRVLLYICELLCFCGRHDTFRTKFLQKNVTEKVLLLTHNKEKVVVAAVIRVFRTLLLSALDDDVQSYVVKNNLMKPIIDVLVANSKRDNLLTSAVLGLLEHICKKNATVLLKYVVDTFWGQLAPFQHLTSIQAFKTKFEQCLLESKESGALDKEKDNCVKHNSDEAKSPTASDPPKEEAEPNYSNIEATITASPSVLSGGLVDYGYDEDDDDDCKHPPEEQTEASEEEMGGLLRLKNKSPSRENDEKEPSKRQKLSSTDEGDKNPQGQGGEAEKSKSCSSDEEKLKENDGSVLEPSESSTDMDVNRA